MLKWQLFFKSQVLYIIGMELGHRPIKSPFKYIIFFLHDIMQQVLNKVAVLSLAVIVKINQTFSSVYFRTAGAGFAKVMLLINIACIQSFRPCAGSSPLIQHWKSPSSLEPQPSLWMS